MKASILAASLASVGLAVAKPTPTVNERATSVGHPAACFYSHLAPSATAYVANMPNNNINANDIDMFFNHFSFNCMGGRNFTTYRLATSTLTPKPWFAGDIHAPMCSVQSVESIISGIMQWQNPEGNPSVTCSPYPGTTWNAFQSEAKKYFASVSKK